MGQMMSVVEPVRSSIPFFIVCSSGKAEHKWQTGLVQDKSQTENQGQLKGFVDSSCFGDA